MWPKLCCPAQDLTVAGKNVSIVVSDASGLGGEHGDAGFARKPTQVELDIALAVDDIAAELQLGGAWN